MRILKFPRHPGVFTAMVEYISDPKFIRAVQGLTIGDVVVYTWHCATVAYAIEPPNQLKYMGVHPFLVMENLDTFYIRRKQVFHASPDSPFVAERTFYDWATSDTELPVTLYHTLRVLTTPTFWEKILIDGELVDGAPYRARYDAYVFNKHMEAIEYDTALQVDVRPRKANRRGFQLHP